ncbi:MAG: MFS transporter [Nitrososphaerales archaeon]|nr:MFS transporter [Nitrososphaerales archaeon]
MNLRYRAFTLFLYNSCLGVFLSYGVFFTKVSNEYKLPASATSLVFGVFAVLFSISSLVLGLYMNTRGPGKTILLGGGLMSAGLLLSSVANSYPLLVLTYGVIGGIGSGSMWMPTSYVVFDSFDSAAVKQVTGLVSAGTAIGLLFFPPLETYLIFEGGLPVAFLTVGLVVLLFTGLAYQTSRSSKVTSRFDLREAFKNLKTKKFGLLYAYYAAGNAFSRTLVTIFLVPLFESRGLGTVVGTLALSLIGVGSMAGRLTTGVKRVSEETMAALGFVLQGACAAGLFIANDAVTIGVLSVLFGIGYGTYIPEFALMVRKYYGVEHYGTVFGMLLTSFGLGAFIGPVFEGTAVSSTGGYLPGFLLAAAASIAVGAHLLFAGKGSGQRVPYPGNRGRNTGGTDERPRVHAGYQQREVPAPSLCREHDLRRVRSDGC